jgi:hypothetical protein
MSKLAQQPRLGELSIAHHRIDQHVEHGGGLLDAEAAQKAQLDDAAIPLVESGQCLECVVEGDEVMAAFVRCSAAPR